MNITNTLAGAAVGGVLGCAAWLGVACVTGYELGILAILVGTACGIGAAIGSKGMAGTKGGVIAGLVTVLSIVAARYFLVQISIHQMVQEAMAEDGYGIPGPEDGEYWTAFMADQIIQRLEESGQAVDWPEYDMEEDSIAAQYPADVWADASAQWRSMSNADRAEFCAAGSQMIMTDNAEGIETFKGVMSIIGVLISNLHPMALIIMGIAVVTAFKVARDSRPKTADDEFTEQTSTFMPAAATGMPGMPAVGGSGGIAAPSAPAGGMSRTFAPPPSSGSAGPQATPPGQGAAGESQYLPPWLRDK